MTGSETPQQAPVIIVASAAEDQRRAHVFAAAVAAAKAANARLILYDVFAPTVWTEPLSDLEHKRYQVPMSPSELRHASRDALADQVEEARRQGVQAWGWLPSDTSAEAMVDYARHVGATRILLSKQIEEPTFIERVHRLTAARAREAAGSAIDLVFIEGDTA